MCHRLWTFLLGTVCTVASVSYTVRVQCEKPVHRLALAEGLPSSLYVTFS